MRGGFRAREKLDENARPMKKKTKHKKRTRTDEEGGGAEKSKRTRNKLSDGKGNNNEPKKISETDEWVPYAKRFHQLQNGVRVEIDKKK